PEAWDPEAPVPGVRLVPWWAPVAALQREWAAARVAGVEPEWIPGPAVWAELAAVAGPEALPAVTAEAGAGPLPGPGVPDLGMTVEEPGAAARLLAAGWAPGTPVTVYQADGRSLTWTPAVLETVEALGTPAAWRLGRGAAAGGRRWPRIWFLREPPAPAVLEAVRERGVVPVVAPVSATAPAPDPAAVMAMVTELDRYAWVVFTSRTAVEVFAAALGGAGADIRRLTARVAVVGAETARALRTRLHLEPDLVATDPRQEGLVAELVPRIGAGERVLLPGGDLNRPGLADAIRARGGRAEPVVLYRTVPRPLPALLAKALAEGGVDGLVVTAPSSLQHLLEALDADGRAGLEQVAIASIGPTTTRALLEAGLRPAVETARPSVAALAEALADRLVRA
ncbi:MAG: uroporphyrinogen-III synthase, partial [Firmicutes bacterium]|nr:uroporphyrinogen-III synthase [Bacillota bacterium]